MDDPKKIGKIMADIGFNPKSSASVKAAFIKSLAQSAFGVDLKIPAIYDSNNPDNIDSVFKTPGEQLELALDNVASFKK